MARKRKTTLRHRGYLYAQMRLSPETAMCENVSIRRMKLANAWRDGYLAAQNDARRKIPK